jgi:hypothetical protein
MIGIANFKEWEAMMASRGGTVAQRAGPAKILSEQDRSALTAPRFSRGADQE